MRKAIFLYDLSRYSRCLLIATIAFMISLTLYMVVSYTISTILGFVLAIILLGVISTGFTIYTAVVFYNTTYGEEALLLHQIPLPTKSLYWAKFLAMYLVNTVYFVLALVFMGLGFALSFLVPFADSEFISALFQEIMGDAAQIGWKYIVIGLGAYIVLYASSAASYVVFLVTVSNMPAFRKYRWIALFIGFVLYNMVLVSMYMLLSVLPPTVVIPIVDIATSQSAHLVSGPGQIVWKSLYTLMAQGYTDATHLMYPLVSYVATPLITLITVWVGARIIEKKLRLG